MPLQSMSMRRTMNRTLLLLSCLGLAVAMAGCKKAASPAPVVKTESKRTYPLTSLKTEPISIGKHQWTVWVMDDDKKREEGLMYAKPGDLPEGKGMLFVFPDAKKRSFWMENTEVALDIAYFGANKKLLNVQRGVPFDESSLLSEGEAQYVLEVKEGTFDSLGIKKGAVLEMELR